MRGRITGILTLVLCIFLVTSSVHANWVDNWLATAVTQGPTSVEGETRSFYGLGSVELRWQTGTAYPVSFTPPALDVGCGGVDIFLGSLSFMDFDHFVQRLKTMMYSAAPFAFYYALGRLCPECKTILQDLDKAADWLNSLSFNECSAGRMLGAFLASYVPERKPSRYFTELLGKLNVESGSVSNRWEFIEDIKTRANMVMNDTDASKLNQDCPAIVQTLAGVHDFIAHLANQANIPPGMDTLMKGLVGDIYFVAGKTFSYKYVRPCMFISNNPHWDVANGTLQQCSTIDPGTLRCECTDFMAGKSIYDYVADALQNYANAVDTKQNPLNAGTVIQMLSRYPVYSLLRSGYEVGDTLLVATSPVVVECAAYEFVQSLIENAIMLTARIGDLVDAVEAACNSKREYKCTYCSPAVLNNLRDAWLQLRETAARQYEYWWRKYQARQNQVCKSVVEYSTQMAKLKKLVHGQYVFFTFGE